MKQPSMTLIGLLLVSEPLFAAEQRFSEPVPLSAIINDENGNGGPSITADGLALYFQSNRPGGYGHGDIWVSRRSSVTDAWGPPTNLVVVNSFEDDNSPSISGDELELYFGRGWWPSGGEIWVSIRESRDQDWPEPVNLGPVVNSSFHEADPYLSADKLELYFGSNRVGTDHDRIYVARRSAVTEDFGPPELVSGEGTWPCLSPDGLILLFVRDLRIFYKTRESIEEAFGSQEWEAKGLQTDYWNVQPRWMSDGTLLFASNRPGLPVPPKPGVDLSDFGIWQSSLMPPLSIERHGDQALLRWPKFPEGFQLEVTSTVDGIWLPVDLNPMDGTNVVEVSLPTTEQGQHFRLKKTGLPPHP
jgi:hypothetical protein